MFRSRLIVAGRRRVGLANYSNSSQIEKPIMFCLPSLIALPFLFLYFIPMTVGSISYGRCESQFNSKGMCVQLADCQFIVDMISGDLNAEGEEVLRKSQCGYDNTYTESSRRIVVCCPEKYLYKTNLSNEAQNGNVLPSAGECGTTLSEFIYGGNKTRVIDYPWMALLRYKTRANELKFLCGGSLINSRYVLTAAHCLNLGHQANGQVLQSVRLGEWDLRTNPDCEVDVRGKKSCAPPFIELSIDEAIPHPKYVSSSSGQFYDIALLRLEQSVNYNDFVRPICLPTGNRGCGSVLVNTTMEVAGWGATDKPRSNSSPVKLAISVRTWATASCHSIYRSWNRPINGTHHLCAGGVSGIDACRGDSGGPLMLPELLKNRIVYFVTGIISFGPEPCGLNGWPGVYACVENYVDWIKGELKP